MNNRTLGSVGVFVVALLLSSSADTVLAQGLGRGQGKPQESGAKTAKDKTAKDKTDKDKTDKDKTDKDKTDKDKVAGPVFGTHDREIINDYYGKRSGLPPGLAKRDGNLPPGLEKQLQRNGTLPPGLQKKLKPFPVALERQLGPLPYGYRRGIVDRHLVVYRTGTHVIADSIFHAVR